MSTPSIVDIDRLQCHAESLMLLLPGLLLLLLVFLLRKQTAPAPAPAHARATRKSASSKRVAEKHTRDALLSGQ